MQGCAQQQQVGEERCESLAAGGVATGVQAWPKPLLLHTGEGDMASQYTLIIFHASEHILIAGLDVAAGALGIFLAVNRAASMHDVLDTILCQLARPETQEGESISSRATVVFERL